MIGRSLLGVPGEEVWAWKVGDFDLLVSFLGDTARAMAVKRNGGPKTALSPSEISAVLALNAPAALWSIQSEAPPPSA